MIFQLQKAFMGVLFLSAWTVQAQQFDDDGWDDDGFSEGGRCFYEGSCLFSCGDALTAEDCLGYTPLNPDAIPFDAPYFLPNDGSAPCTATSDAPKKVGVCCDNCDIDNPASSKCTSQYVNPEHCAQQDKVKFLDKIEEYKLGTHVGACHDAEEMALANKVGSGSGDPHFKTFSGDKFDYHGECDLVLIDNPDFNNGQGLKLHIRTTRVQYYSYIERVAIQIGEDVLEFANDAQNFLLNGTQAEPNKRYHKTLLGGFIVRRDPKALSIRFSDAADGSYHSHSIAKIDFLVRKNGFPAVIVNAGDSDAFKGSLGLLGDWATGTKLGRDGTTVFEVDPTNAENFALEWQVRDTEPVLFKEARAPQFPAKCTPPKKIMGSRLGRSHMEKEAEKVCAHFKGDKSDCLFDVIATRSVGAASQE